MDVPLEFLFLFFGFRGCEPCAEETVRLVHDTGGVSVLAHPWALKNPVAVIRSLKEAGLHGLEVYRSDGKLSGTKPIVSCSILLVLKLRNYRESFVCSFLGLNSIQRPSRYVRPSEAWRVRFSWKRWEQRIRAWKCKPPRLSPR